MLVKSWRRLLIMGKVKEEIIKVLGCDNYRVARQR